MGRINKTYALILTLIITIPCLTLMTVNPADAQIIPKPSVPDFTVALIDSSYDVPPASSVNPYNGEVTTEAGRHIESRTIQIAVKNQPFTPFSLDNKTVYLHYEVHWKGHFETEWHQEYYPLEYHYLMSVEDARLRNEYSVFSYKDYWPQDAQIDFQVKARIGYVQYVDEGIAGLAFRGKESNWSSTQTIDLSQTPASPSATPAIPELSSLVILPLILSLLTIAVVAKYRRAKHE